MRYLKLFKESNDYRSVEYNDWSDVLSKYVQFEKRYFDNIKSRLKSGYEITIINQEDIRIDGGRWDTYEISQCSDEWFFIKKEVNDIMSGPYNESYNYYKCDQFDGLLKFLKDYNIID